MVALLNPYVAGNPVGASPAFVGRDDVLREVLRTLRRPQANALVLYGQRRIGKTSILEHLAYWLPREGEYTPVYFDLQDKATWKLGQVLSALAASMAGALGKPAPELGADPQTAFRANWLPALLKELPERSSLVLLFDEFDVLADPKSDQAGKAFFPYLRELLAVDTMRLQFVFVIGRNVNDLDTIALSVFKGTDSRRVSLLDKADAAALVQLSESNGSLHWGAEAIEQVWNLTHGHPFLTQQLCSHVWERAHDAEPDETPTASTDDVEAVIDDVLAGSQNALEWLWDGLPAAERIVISALAEAGHGSITLERLEQCLHESGVRVVIRDLQNAPRQLQDWDVLEPDQEGLRFRVELLRRWLVAYKPLRRVQEEIDHIEPVAQSYYQAGLGLYRSRKLEEAIDPLRRAISLNPNHQSANLLLADVLLSQGELDAARQILERLYEYQPSAARHRLVQIFLLQAQNRPEDEELAFYDRVLKIDETQVEALARKRAIWMQRGVEAHTADQLEVALEAFRIAGATEHVTGIEKEIASRRLATELSVLETTEREGDYQKALAMALRLSKKFPEQKHWTEDIVRLEKATEMAEWYKQAIGAIQSNDLPTARRLLAQIIAIEPSYRDASRYLYQAVTGSDPEALKKKLETSESKLREIMGLTDQGPRKSKEPEDGKRQPWKALHEGKATPKPRRLVLWNPLDGPRLLWWFFFKPKYLQAYREAYSREDEFRLGDWILSTFFWLPFFLPMAAISFGYLKFEEGTTASPTLYYLSAIFSFLIWLVWGMTNSEDTDDGNSAFLSLPAIVLTGTALGSFFSPNPWLFFACLGLAASTGLPLCTDDNKKLQGISSFDRHLYSAALAILLALALGTHVFIISNRTGILLFFWTLTKSVGAFLATLIISLLIFLLYAASFEDWPQERKLPAPLVAILLFLHLAGYTLVLGITCYEWPRDNISSILDFINDWLLKVT